MKYLRMILNACLTAVTPLLVCSMSSCAEMSQEHSGQTGGLVGAGIGALATGALAKSSGANRGQTAFAGVLGGLGGYKVGQQIGRENGAPGVSRTEVPSE